MEVQRPVLVVQAVRRMDMIVGTDHTEGITCACRPRRRRVEHFMEPWSHVNGEPEATHDHLRPCVGGTK